MKDVTRFHHSGWIDCDVSFVNVPDDSFFIDQEGGTIPKPLLLIENAIVLNNSAFEIAEDRKGNSNLFCEFAVGGNTVYTHAKDLGVG